MPKMTIEQALKVLRTMDKESTARFTPKQREAILVVGVAWKMGELADSVVEGLLHDLGVTPDKPLRS